MTDRQFIAFIAVADKGSFYKAAPELFVSSQALLQQINLLEREIGTTLLDRTHKGVVLTEAGKVFYEEAKKSMLRQQKLIARVREVSQRNQQKIRLTISDTPDYMHRIAVRFAQLHPEIKLENVHAASNGWPSLLVDEAVDIIEGSFAKESQNFNIDFLPLEYKKRAALMLPSDPLAQRQILCYEDFAGREVAVHSLEWAKDLCETIREKAEEVQFLEIPCTLPNVFECCLSGKIYLVPEGFANGFDPLVVREINSDIRWPFGLAYRHEHTPAVDAFLEVAKEMCRIK